MAAELVGGFFPPSPPISSLPGGFFVPSGPDTAFGACCSPKEQQYLVLLLQRGWRLCEPTQVGVAIAGTPQWWREAIVVVEEAWK